MSYKRVLINGGEYHVYNRGNGKMNIFPTDNDKKIFLRQILKSQIENKFILYGYCIMDNHYHLFYMDIGEKIPDIIGCIQENYAIYYNAKYNHTGHVFQSPFKSKVIIGIQSFFRMHKYIIRNPIVAGIVNELKNYKWVSYLEEQDIFGLIDFNYVHDFYNKYNAKSYFTFLNDDSEDKKTCKFEAIKMNNEEAVVVVNEIINRILERKKSLKNEISTQEYIEVVKEANYKGVTKKQISDITGLSYNFVKSIRVDKEYI